MNKLIKHIGRVLTSDGFNTDFLSLCNTVAIDSTGIVFRVGDKVKHEGADPNEVGEILEFFIDEEYGEIGVNTTLGVCHLNYIYHV